VIGPAIASSGYALFAIPGIGGTYWTTFFPAVLVVGLGMATTVAPLTTTVMDAVPENRAGVASGINNAVSRTAGLLGIAFLGIVMVLAFSNRLEERLAQLPLTSEQRRSIDEQRVRLAGIELPSDVDNATKGKLSQAINESFVHGFRLVMMAGMGLALASAVSAFMMIEGRTPTSSRQRSKM
jgi:hypothetical protein